MMFTTVISAVVQFSPDQLWQLREYIQQREQQRTANELKVGTLNMDELLEEMRAGLTDEEFSEIERAMNAESL